MPTAPNVENYFIGTGIVSFKKTGESLFRDLGNCPKFTITSDVTTKEHKSSRGGVKVTDVERVTEVAATVDLDLDEIVDENLAYFALAEVDTNTAGDSVLLGLTDTQITGILKCTGQNDIGQRITWEGKVQFIPSGAFALIEEGDDYGKIPLKAKVLVGDLGEFGKWTILDVAT